MSNLFTVGIHSPDKKRHIFKALHLAVFVIGKTNQNIIPKQKSLLKWHFKLVHIVYHHVKWLLRTLNLKVQGNAKDVANCAIPKCAA